MNQTLRETLTRFLALFQYAAPASDALDRRSLRIERNVILPVRLVVIGILYQSLQFSPWIGYVSYSLDVGVETVSSLFRVYVVASVAGGLLLTFARRIPATVGRSAILLLGLLDALFLAGLTLITGGYDSILYWVFIILVLRNTIVEPLSPTQLIMNTFTSSCYLLAGVSDFVLAHSVDEPTRVMLGLNPAGNPVDVLVVRTCLLLLVAVCGFGVQLLLERQRRAEAEAVEFGRREHQLRSTGRLAAEIAHQLKNPLAIINNTTFSLQRAVSPREREMARFTEIIREEVERADRILTQIMGYARMTEEKVEKLNIAALLDSAVQEVFPEAAEFNVTVLRDYQPALPRLLMQRAHLHGIMINLLTNARDACEGAGVIEVKLVATPEGGVTLSVRDDGRGIPEDQLARVFEAYYTTKSKGTGLGLAITKNTAELYDGNVRAESELGKGSCFSVNLPPTVAAPSRA
jgi:signal transduction histidine kinase